MTELVYKRCELCGSVMKTDAPRALYCDACKEALRDARRTYRISEKEREKRRAEVENRDQSGILAVLRKAEEEGLSYGHYVAKHDI